MNNTDYQPLFLKDLDLEKFKKENTKFTYVDAFQRQLKELFFIVNKKYIGTNKDDVYKTDDYRDFVESKKNSYIYIHYSWNNHLVKCITENEYFILKTNRNQDLITFDEQNKLKDYKIAVLGMSVGSNIAFVATQAGISNEIILADFDELDTTNLNRILAGVHQVGINKTVVAARKIYEDNPFAKVTILPEGVTETNFEGFLKQKKIDCIVEEIDDINFKIKIRLLSMKYKIPVVMVTDNGDGVVLHVERYDLGSTTIWGKNPEYFQEKIKNGPITKEKAGEIIMFDIVGGPDRVDPRMISSVKRVLAKELVSWSQLGSSAILGGVVATYIIKKIALGEKTDLDIRSHISPESINHGTHKLP